MITRRTKIQLVIFVIITLLGVSFVGARYAKLDRAHRRRQLRGHRPLRRLRWRLRRQPGHLPRRRRGQGRPARADRRRCRRGPRIEKDEDDIPADTLALAGNGSAVGEQYVELQPQTDDRRRPRGRVRRSTPRRPRSRSPPRRCSPTCRPPSSSVDKDAAADHRRGVLRRLRRHRRGPAAADRLGQLLHRGRQRQLRHHHRADPGQQHRPERSDRSESALRNFATELSGFSTALAASDPDLRRLIETGSTSTIELRDFIEDNRVELGSLFNNLVTTGNIIVQHLDGIKQVLVVYPYVVEGGFTVVSKSKDTGLYDAHFGMIITDTARATRATAAPRSASRRTAPTCP